MGWDKHSCWQIFRSHIAKGANSSTFVEMPKFLPLGNYLIISLPPSHTSACNQSSACAEPSHRACSVRESAMDGLRVNDANFFCTHYAFLNSYSQATQGLKSKPHTNLATNNKTPCKAYFFQHSSPPSSSLYHSKTSLRTPLSHCCTWPKPSITTSIGSGWPCSPSTGQGIKGFASWNDLRQNDVCVNMGVSKNNGTPKSSILRRFSLINHPILGVKHPYFWKHPYVKIIQESTCTFLTYKLYDLCCNLAASLVKTVYNPVMPQHVTRHKPMTWGKWPTARFKRSRMVRIPSVGPRPKHGNICQNHTKNPRPTLPSNTKSPNVCGVAYEKSSPPKKKMPPRGPHLPQPRPQRAPKGFGPQQNEARLAVAVTKLMDAWRHRCERA